jgi:putative two-component system response regulator
MFISATPNKLILDVFDTLTHCRQYKKAWNIDNSVNTIKERRDTQFDPELVDIFLNI